MFFNITIILKNSMDIDLSTGIINKDKMAFLNEKESMTSGLFQDFIKR